MLVPPRPSGDAYDPIMDDYHLVVRSARAQSSTYELTADAATADLILFVGSRDSMHRDVRSHPAARRYGSKVFLFDSADQVIPFLPGVYTSIERRYFNKRRVRSGFYLRNLDAPWVYHDPAVAEARYLFSFAGAVSNGPVRRRLAGLENARGLIVDTTDAPGRGYGQAPSVYDRYKAEYGKTLAASKFILCPRGVGPASMRIFESLKAGRSPVIISDTWVPPSGPKWEDFAIRVAERDISSLPQQLERREVDAARLGEASRKAWDEWFSPSRAVTTIVGWCLEILASRRLPEAIAGQLVKYQIFRPFYIRHHVLRGLLRRAG